MCFFSFIIIGLYKQQFSPWNLLVFSYIFSRFEQEILGAQQPLVAAAPALVIGANTFSSVQEQLASLRAQVYKGNNTRQPAPSNISTGEFKQVSAIMHGHSFISLSGQCNVVTVC